MKKKKELTKKEILEKLIWFHGEEYNKYPLEDDLARFCKTRDKGPKKDNLSVTDIQNPKWINRVSCPWEHNKD